MAEADDAAARADGRNAEGGDARNEHRVDIGGDARGPVVAGNHNVVVDAQHGSTVTLLVEGDRPRPVRRDRIALLPRSPGRPVGREAETRALEDAVRAGGLVQLWGPPGVGKSTLLRHAARSLGPGPDGVVFLSAAHREVGDLAQEVFEACYDARGYAPSGAELRRLMTGLRVTVYVDNANLTPEQLRELADAAPDATFVFAGHDRSLLGDGTALEMTGLEREAGRELLARELQRPLEEGELAAADELWKAALGRPLLLLRAAGLARSGAPGEAVLPRPGAMAELLPLLFDQLDAEASSALHLLATLGDAELDPVHIGDLTDVPDPVALCERLVNLGLAEVSERGYRCAPDAVVGFRERNPQPFAADRLCDHFTGWLSQPTTTPDEVAAHGRALEVTAQLAELAGRPDLAVRVARAASPALTRSLRFGVWGRLLGRGWGAARQAGDRTSMAYFTHEEGIRSLLTGRRVVSAVLLAEAVVLWRQLGDAQGADSALNAQQYAPPADAGSPPAPDGGGTAGDPATDVPSPDGGPSAPDGGGSADPTATADPSTAADPTATADPSTLTGPSPADGGNLTSTGAPPGPDATAPNTATDHMAQLAQNPGDPGVQHAMPGADTAAQHAAQAGAGHSGGAAAGTTGGVHSGAAATTAATTGAVTGSGITALLAVAAVIGAVVIGSDFVSDLPESFGQGSSSDQLPTGLPSYSPSPATSGPGNDLAGVWSTGNGLIRIVSAGPGSYTVQNPRCDPDTIQVTGTDGSYRGRLPVFSDLPGSCTSHVGYGTVTFEVSASGSTARVEKTGPTDGSSTCNNCGTETWTRRSS